MLTETTVAQLSKADAKAQLEEKRSIINAIYTQLGPEQDWKKVSAVHGSFDDKLAAFNELVVERDVLTLHLTKLENAEIKGKLNQDSWLRSQGLSPELGDMPPASTRAGVDNRLRTFFNENPQFRAYAANPHGPVRFEIPGLSIRNLIATVDVSTPQRDGISEMGVERRTVSQLFVQGQATSTTIDYLQETTFDNTAQETAEGDLSPLDDIGYELVTETVRDVSDFIPIPKNVLSDAGQVESEFRSRLGYSVQFRLDRQCLRGDGVGVNLKGVMNRTYVQTYARLSSESNTNAIITAGAMVEGSEGAGFATADAIVMHPKNWLTIRLSQEVGGQYIMGPAGLVLNKQIDGIPVVTTTAMPLGTALVGAFTPYGVLEMREGLSVEMSTEHADYFRRGLVALRAVVRAALKITRPSAFCLATNLN